MLSTLSAFVASVTGKVVLGTAITAASVGGLHAGDVVDVPGLPQDTEQEIATTEETADPASTEDASLEEDEGTEEVEEVETEEDAPSEFSLAMEAWSECVDAASAAHDESTETVDASESGTPGRFDPEEACGPRPDHGDFAETGQPADVEARVTAVREWTDCVRANAPDHHAVCGRNPAAAEREGDVEGEGSDEGTVEAQDAPSDAAEPKGPPADAPAAQGPPESTPAEGRGRPAEEGPETEPETGDATDGSEEEDGRPSGAGSSDAGRP